MTATGVALAALVVFGVAATRASVARAVTRARAERLAVDLDSGRQATRARARLSTAPGWFVDALDYTPVTSPVDKAWRHFLCVAAAVGLMATWLAGPVLGLVAIGVVSGAPQAVRIIGAGKRASAYDASLAVALDGVARAVRGGGSLQSAVGEAADGLTGQVGDDLRRVAATVQRGARLDAALGDWRARRDRASVRLAVGAVTLAAQTGGPPARVIEDVAASLRTRLQIEGEARALGAQARLSAIVVGVAPIGFALVACAADPRNAQLIFGTPIGLACVVCGLLLDVAGALWMHRISETVLR